MKGRKSLIAVCVIIPALLILASSCSNIGRAEVPVPPETNDIATGSDVKPPVETPSDVEIPVDAPPVIVETPDAEVVVTPITTPPEEILPVEVIPAPVVYTIGDTGEAIRGIQTSLNKFNYNLKVDGSFGSRTLWAVKNFQTKNKLPVNGIVDELVLEKLCLQPTKETTYVPPPPATTTTVSDTTIENFVNNKGLSSSTSYLIWVDTKAIYTYVFTGYEGNWDLVRSMRSTVGSAETPTIKGTFKVIGKGSYFTVPDHEEWICKYYTQFYQNYLIHSVVYDVNDKLVDGRLGMKLSHGCVRVALENAKYIYYNVPIGSTVYLN